jgi:hypothetical protein
MQAVAQRLRLRAIRPLNSSHYQNGILKCAAASALAAAVLLSQGGAADLDAVEEEHWTAELLARAVDDLDEGYAPRTTNPLTVVRKRTRPKARPGEPEYTKVPFI